MALKKVHLEGKNQYLELASCKVGELPEIVQIASKLVNIFNPESIEEAANEIVVKFAPSLAPEELTINDLWAILYAKVGDVGAEILRKMTSIAADRIDDFLASPNAELQAQLEDIGQELTVTEKTEPKPAKTKSSGVSK